MTRGRPKYPRKRKTQPPRLLAPGLALLVLVVALGAFGVYKYAGEDRQTNRELDRLADSLTSRPGQPAEAASATGAGSAGDKSAPAANNAGRKPSAPAETASLAPQAHPVPPSVALPESRSPSAGPAGASAQGGAPLQSGAGASSSAHNISSGAPFAGLSLEQLGATFARAYGSLKPRQWGEHLAGVTRRLDPAGGLPAPSGTEGTAPAPAATTPAGGSGRPTVALTLDACDGGRGTSYDAGIIALLREKRIPATIFVTSRWMRGNPEALRDLAADPLFEIAAHGSRHKPCSVNGNSVYGIKGTASFDELTREVEGNARDIAAATGRRPRWFRSGTAYYDDVAVRVIRDLGLGIAGYSIAGDEGASLPAAKVAAKTLAAKDGDILLYHLNHPRSGTREGLERSLPVLLEKGFVFVRLSPEQ